MQNLLTLCTSAACDRERSYIGTMVGNSWVNQDTSHKWGNRAYVAHTTSRKYIRYAYGGGYFLSLDLVQVRACKHCLIYRVCRKSRAMWLACSAVVSALCLQESAASVRARLI